MKVTLVCDCGCGEMLEKRPSKVRPHNFKSFSHYQRWVKARSRRSSQSVLNRLKAYGELRKLSRCVYFVELSGGDSE